MERRNLSVLTFLTVAALMLHWSPAQSVAFDPPGAANPRSNLAHAKEASEIADLSLVPAKIPDSSREGIIPGIRGDRVVVYRHEGPVARIRADGDKRWVTQMDGVGFARSPNVTVDANRAYVAQYLNNQVGITALDVRSGRVLWRSPGPEDRMLLKGDLLLAADCGGGTDGPDGGRWLLARRVDSGKEAFRVALPLKDFDALPILEAANLFVVQTHEHPGGKGDALLFDRAGRVRHRLDRQVVALMATGKDWLVLTNRDVIRLGLDGPPRWTAPFTHGEWIAGGGLFPLSGADVVAYLYGAISDSGIQVLRLDPATGRKRWEVKCAGLGVQHSKYRHEALVEVVGARLKVTSRASGGTFVEALDAQTGRSLARRLID